MPTVPVYVPSYDLSGDTHRIAVGDRVVWRLALIEQYVPDHVLGTIEATAEPLREPYPELNYYPTLLRQGAFVAWWEAGRAISGTVNLRAAFAIGDTRFDDDEVPEAGGRVVRLYEAFDLLRQRQDGPWDRVPALGLAEVDSTESEPVGEGFTAYSPAPGVDPNDGQWRHIGWLAMVEFSAE